MDFKEALDRAVKINGEASNDPFLLYSIICDLIGNDYQAKKAAEEFYRRGEVGNMSGAETSSAPAPSSPKAAKPLPQSQKKKKHPKKPQQTVIPDDAIVFFADSSRTFHLSIECSGLKRASHAYYTCHDHAKVIDLKSKRSWLPWYYNMFDAKGANERLKKHKIPICKICGGDEPWQKYGTWDRFAKWVFEHFGIDLHRTKRVW